MELDDGYILFNKELIGSGRHSRVFLGQSKIKQKIVFKLFKDHRAYERELSILKTLHNKCSVPEILSTGTIDVMKYVVLPKYTITLQNFVKNNGILSLNEGLYLLYELVICLEEIHALNIVHRDIKPLNIMLHDKELIIIDFSLATTTEKKTVSCVGSPMFMSLNAHYKKIKKYTYKDDLESAYYTFLYCINGELPWSNIPDTMSKDDTLETILAQKKEHKRQYIVSKNNHEDILLEIEELFEKHDTTLEYEQKKFYKKFDLKNSHSIF